MAKSVYTKRNIKYRNWIINGDMAICQRGNAVATPFTSIADTQYMTDRFRYGKTATAVHNVSQDTDVPTVSQSGIVFTNSLRLTLTTPDTSITTTEAVDIQQRIEGINYAQFAQRVFTLSFWVKATAAGIYCVAFRNSGQDRSYVAEYTVNATATWEYKTITVAAPPSAGTWNYSNGIGLLVSWTLAAGPTLQTTANSWQTGNFIATSNQVNGVNTGATDFRLTGVMLNEGPDALPFRLFNDSGTSDLSACQRYFEKTYDVGTPPSTATFTGAHSFNHPGGVGVEGNYYYRVTKRASATVTFYSPQTGASGVFRDTTSGVDRSTTQLRTGTNNIAFSTAGVPAGSPDVAGQLTAEAEL